MEKRLRAVSMELTEDGWESVFKKLPIHDLKSVSLVSKQFYSISNTLVSKLQITYSEDQYLLLPQLLRRFTSLKSIQFHPHYFTTTGDRSLIKIAHSGLKHLHKLDLGRHLSLPVEGIKELGFANMRSLKVLCCCYVRDLNDSDLFVIASSLPWLQELDINGCSQYISKGVTDTGVAQLAGNLQALLRIDISYNKFISDQSLYCLLSSCLRIAEINCSWCPNITVKAIIDAICGYPKLLSLKSGWVHYDRSDLSCCCLTFKSDIGDHAHTLASIERANLPLHKIIFNTMHCSDLHISSLLSFLRKLRAITITRCYRLTNATFCLLVENCLSLTEFKMSCTALGKETNLLGVMKNYAIKTLTLDRNEYLNDETLKRIVLSCPNLECLEVCYCDKVTDEGIGYVLNNCPGIMKLKVYSCKPMNFPWVEKGRQVSELKLEILGISGVEADDKRMSMIAERFPHLVQLKIRGRGNVSAKGVEELMERCKRLREVRLGQRRSIKDGL